MASSVEVMAMGGGDGGGEMKVMIMSEDGEVVSEELQTLIDTPSPPSPPHTTTSATTTASTHLFTTDIQAKLEPPSSVVMATSSSSSRRGSSRSSRRRKSAVWCLMEQVSASCVQCQVCQDLLAYSGGTSGMMKHIRTRHPRDYTTLCNTQDATHWNTDTHTHDTHIDTDTYTHAHSTARTHTPPTHSNTHTNTQLHNDVMARKTTKNTVQAKVQYREGSLKRKYFDNLVLDMLVSELQPLITVEKPSFKRLVDALNQRYCLPSKREITASLLPATYEKHVKNVKEMLKRARHVALSCDFWTSMSGRSFVTVTAHFVDVTWEAKALVLRTTPVCDEGRDVAEELRKICDEWDLGEKVCCVVSEREQVTGEVTEGKMGRHSTCFAHTLNRIVRDAIRNTAEVTAVTEKVRKIVTYFERDSEATRRLAQIQDDHDDERKELLNDHDRNWLSTYYMLERYVEVRESVRAALLSQGRGEMCLEEEEAAVVEQSVCVLQPFESAVTDLCLEEFTSMSKVIPMVRALQSCLASSSSSSSSSSLTSSSDAKRTKTQKIVPLALQLQTEITRKFPSLETDLLYGAATLLDPRFKKVPFIDASNLKVIKERICDLVTSEGSAEGGQQQEEEVEEGEKRRKVECVSEVKVRKVCIWRELDNLVEEKRCLHPSVRSQMELKRYLEQPMITRGEAALLWWKEHSLLFPRLQDVAKRFLCVPSSCVPAEGVFLTDAGSWRHRRRCLEEEEEEVVDAMLFLNGNVRYSSS